MVVSHLKSLAALTGVYAYIHVDVSLWVSLQSIHLVTCIHMGPGLGWVRNGSICIASVILQLVVGVSVIA